MAHSFTKSVTTTTVAENINGSGPECTYMSVKPLSIGIIDLVIGANYDDRCAASLSKIGLAELINILTDIHAAMED